jgi:hypothetical protein
MISNNTLEPLVLTTDLILGSVTPLIPRAVFIVPTTDTSVPGEELREEVLTEEILSQALFMGEPETTNVRSVEDHIELTVDENEIFDPGGVGNELPFSGTNYDPEHDSPGYFGVDPLNTEHAATDEDLDNILDLKYVPADPDRAPFFRQLLRNFRDRFTRSFYGETWEGGVHDINLIPGTSPYKGRAFRFSKEHMEVLKK